MARHLKDKKIIIYKETKGGTSPAGYPLPSKWQPIHPGRLWAYARHLSAKEWWAAGVHAELQQEERFFVINWRDDVTADMMILYKGTWYDITRVDPFEDYKGDIKLYVKEAIGGHIPDVGDILPYE